MKSESELKVEPSEDCKECYCPSCGGRLARCDMLRIYKYVRGVCSDGLIWPLGPGSIDWNSQKPLDDPARFVCVSCKRLFVLHGTEFVEVADCAICSGPECDRDLHEVLDGYRKAYPEDWPAKLIEHLQELDRHLLLSPVADLEEPPEAEDEAVMLYDFIVAVFEDGLRLRGLR